MLLVKIFFEFHAQVQKCHFGNFSILPKWHFWSRAWNSNFLGAKNILLKHYKMAMRNFIHKLSQGPPNPGLLQEKVQKGDFLRKPSRKLKNYFCFRIVRIPRTPGRVNWKLLVFFCHLKTYTGSVSGVMNFSFCFENTLGFDILKTKNTIEYQICWIYILFSLYPQIHENPAWLKMPSLPFEERWRKRDVQLGFVWFAITYPELLNPSLLGVLNFDSNH